MRAFEYRLAFAACAAGIALVAIGPGCTQKAPALAELPPPEVTIGQPVVKEVTDSFEFTGNTAAVEEVQIRARVSGYLKSVHFTEGEEVEQGELLFQIDPDEYQAAVDRAEAEAARQDAMVKKSSADLARTQQLFQKGVRTREELDQDAAAFAVAQAGLAGAQANLRQAKLDLAYTRITAPISGRMSKANVTPGNLIQPGGSENTVLSTIVRLDPIYAYFTVDERTMLRYQDQARSQGRPTRVENVKEWKAPVDVGLANEDGFPHRGILDFVDNRIDPSTGTILARAVFDNRDRALTPGLFVRVRLPFGEPHQAVLITDRAIGTDQGQKYALVVDRAAGERQNVAEYRPLRLGALHDGLRVVESGLTANDWVIVNGIQRVRPGITVAPREGPMPGPPGVKRQPASPASKPASKPQP